MKAIALEVNNSIKLKEPKKNTKGQLVTHKSVMKVRHAHGEENIWSWENAFSGVKVGDVVYLKRNGEYLNYDKERKFTPIFDSMDMDSLNLLSSAIDKKLNLDGKKAPIHIAIELAKICEEASEADTILDNLLQHLTGEQICYLSAQTFADVAIIASRCVSPAENTLPADSDIPF